MCEMMLKALPENAGLNMRAQSCRGEEEIEKTGEQTSLISHSNSARRKLESSTTLESRDHE